ncbi:hypothetical protein AA0481_2200 [Acetobacter orientalis NRIC 0481]|uniref:Uncharacterized protein n=1 Tax=Acetobacter orientalis TaxID=146474 RepID=A0A0D6NN17_9PROT|nr:hypothetical protein Abor_026_004 [Acetobacter orientalis]GBR20746.1 hypothetical protein AA0481_2200 [Acetobacter orientalis NRIC 0481]
MPIFTAAQAAQQGATGATWQSLFFTAAQAAQKTQRTKGRTVDVFTAAQAAQKRGSAGTDQRAKLHCRTGSSETKLPRHRDFAGFHCRTGSLYVLLGAFIVCLERCKRASGGAEGNRTPDLLIANEALSQLSYSPACFILRVQSGVKPCQV